MRPALPPHPGIRFHVDDPETARKVTTLFIQENAKRGLILSTGFFFNTAHDVAALDHTEAAVRESFAVIRDGLENRRLDALLQCETREDLFRTSGAIAPGRTSSRSRPSAGAER